MPWSVQGLLVDAKLTGSEYLYRSRKRSASSASLIGTVSYARATFLPCHPPRPTLCDVMTILNSTLRN